MKRIVRPRNTGRFGNLLFEYVFWYLVAIQYGIKFENTLEPFPEPFNKVPSLRNKTEPMDIKFPFKMSGSVPDYPMDFKYYLGYRDLIRSILHVPIMKKEYDILVHIRLDDVFDPDEPLYSVMPLSFYKNALENIQKIHGSLKNFKILLVSRPINDFQKGILNDILETIKVLSGSENVSVQNGSMTEDLLAIMSSRIIIGSTSSFWTLPSFVGICSEVHIPNFGQARAYKFLKHAKLIKKGLYGFLFSEYNVYIYNVSITRKILTTSIQRMYDL